MKRSMHSTSVVSGTGQMRLSRGFGHLSIPVVFFGFFSFSNNDPGIFIASRSSRASGKAFSWDARPGWACTMLRLSHMAWAAFFFRSRMMDTHNSIDFVHLEAGRDRHGKTAACKGICWPLGRINPKKKLLLHLIPCLIRYRCANQGIFELVESCFCDKCDF